VVRGPVRVPGCGQLHVPLRVLPAAPALLRVLYIFLRADGDFGPDFRFSGLEGDLEVELVVDGCLLGGPAVADDVAHVAEGGDEGVDVVFGELAGGLAVGLAGVAGECGGAFGFTWRVHSATARTRSLIRFRSPFDMPPNTDMIKSWASESGSIGPPTSGTHSSTP
jgi:hypothetical protein